MINSITIRNFRCFENETFDLSAPVVIILGENGSGKTSLLEALFYATGLRSFKTRSPRECIHWGAENCTIHVHGTNRDDTWDLRVCVTANGERMVKLNGNAVSAWHEATAQCNAIAISEEDLMLIEGAPEDRRRFLDHAIALENREYLKQLLILRRIIRQKNALLAAGYCSPDAYALWTEQLLEVSKRIRNIRVEYLGKLHATIHQLLHAHGLEKAIGAEIAYRDTSEIEQLSRETLFVREKSAQRSLCGAHLDDITIILNGAPARQYASRGQQKMLAFLLKAGVISLLSRPTLILVDDFMTDFDEKNASTLLELAKKLGGQLILTAPQTRSVSYDLLGQITHYVELKKKIVTYSKKERERLA